MKTRQRWMIVIAAALLLATTVIVLPQIIWAKRSTELPAKKSLSLPVLTSSSSQGQKNNVVVGASVHNDTSPPLRDIKPEKVGKKVEREANENPKVPATLKHKDSPDTVVQSASSVAAFAGLNMPRSEEHT